MPDFYMGSGDLNSDYAYESKHFTSWAISPVQET